MDPLFDMAVILNSIVSHTFYGMLRGTKNPIIPIGNVIQNGRSIAEKVRYAEWLIGISQPNLQLFYNSYILC